MIFIFLCSFLGFYRYTHSETDSLLIKEEVLTDHYRFKLPGNKMWSMSEYIKWVIKMAMWAHIP